MKPFKYQRTILAVGADMILVSPWNNEWNVRVVEGGIGVISVNFSPVKRGHVPYYVDHGVSILERKPTVKWGDA